jgi:Fe-S-cluster containining protein
MIIGNKWHIRSVCKWLQGGRCTIYDDRPEACKVFKVGGEDCRAAQEAFK